MFKYRNFACTGYLKITSRYSTGKSWIFMKLVTMTETTLNQCNGVNDQLSQTPCAVYSNLFCVAVFYRTVQTALFVLYQVSHINIPWPPLPVQQKWTTQTVTARRHERFVSLTQAKIQQLFQNITPAGSTVAHTPQVCEINKLPVLTDRTNIAYITSRTHVTEVYIKTLTFKLWFDCPLNLLANYLTIRELLYCI